MQLVDEGTIGLDDPVEDHLPGLLPNGDEITFATCSATAAG